MQNKSSILQRFTFITEHELEAALAWGKSFATNFYEKIPITYLLNFTGHKSERQLLT